MAFLERRIVWMPSGLRVEGMVRICTVTFVGIIRVLALQKHLVATYAETSSAKIGGTQTCSVRTSSLRQIT